MSRNKQFFNEALNLENKDKPYAIATVIKVIGSSSGKVGDKAIFACYTAVTKDLPGGKMYSGAPAREIKEKNKRDAVYFDVERLKKRLTLIEDKLKN